MLSTATLSFGVKDFHGSPSVTPVVNQVSLSHLAFDFEKDRQFELAGGYGGLVPSRFNYGRLSRYFLGDFDEGSYFAKWGHIFVLGCRGCGEVGCWPLVCRVNQSGGKIVWDSLQQPHRSKRDYSQFGPFEFEEPQCREALAELERRLSSQSRSDEIELARHVSGGNASQPAAESPQGRHIVV